MLTVINMVVALCLAVCYTSTYISPADFWIPALVGLAYPIFIVLNIAFLIYWIFRWKIEFLISLIAILLGINHLNSFVQLPFGRGNNNEGTIKLMTYNANMFQLHSWAANAPVHEEVVGHINENGYNVVCFQEFFVRNGKFTEADARTKLGMNSKVKYTSRYKQTGYGIATFSKFPIAGSGEVQFSGTYNACIYTDIVVNTDTIRIYNAHLQSLRLKDRNLKFLLNNESRSSADAYEEVWDIISLLRNAFEKRVAQVDSITAHAGRCRFPVIICGDFNDSPLSYTYRQMLKNRKDAFVEAGAGVAITYKQLWPAYRIDYIMHSKSLRTTNYNSPRIPYSDHLPVVAGIEMK